MNRIQQTNETRMAWFEVTLETGERLRACRINGETTRVVIVEYRPANAGWFGDGAVWVLFEHEDVWANVAGHPRFALPVEAFLKIVPELAPLFEREAAST